MSHFLDLVRSLKGPAAKVSKSGFRQWLRCEQLEDRLVPSGYLPPTYYVTLPEYSAPSADSPLNNALNYLATHSDQFGLSPSDLNDIVVTDQYTNDKFGITHIYLRQKVNGLEVENANFSIAVAADGRIISAGGSFVPGLANLLSSSTVVPTLTASQAVQKAADALGINNTKSIDVISPPSGIENTTVISAADVSLDNITAKLHYIPTADGSATLGWQLIIQTTDYDHWYDLSISDSTGAIISQSDWVDHATYNVIAAPNESVQDGGFVVLTNPHDLTASPFGWHDTNGIAGPEFTDTRGNNTDVHLDTNGDNVPDGTRPDGGAALDFSGFTFDPATSPGTTQNQNIAQVNLFYAINYTHDVMYHYGFTEAAGNFQVNNYGRGGLGNDPVQGDAQDGSGTDNANFATPPDGFSPRMQMFLWTSTNPSRDGDLDNSIIFHEYGHGVSNRLTGGPSNSNALNADQSGTMGEAWSEFYTIMMLQRATDTKNAGYGTTSWAIGQSQSSSGLQAYVYSYNMALNPHTFELWGDTGTTSYGRPKTTEVHAAGEAWTAALWDMNWLLIDKYGFDSNLLTGWSPNAGTASAGNKLALQLVNTAMSLQPANPSFIQARDAILAADVAINGGADQAEIWAAFARRGLGLNASTANSNSHFINIDFTVPVGITISPTATAVVEGNSGTKALTFTVSLSAATANTVRVNFATANGTATVADGDYVASNGTLTFAPGELTKTITVFVRGDTKFENNETFTVRLTSPSNGFITQATATVTILNDDTLIKPDVRIVAVATAGSVVAEVRALDPSSNAVRWAVNPFDGFTGTVSIAVGDVNNDGYQDVIVGAGPGAGPRVVALNGIDGSQIASFFAYSPTFKGGVNVASADYNRDGYADIVVGAALGSSHVKVFDGRNNSTLFSFLALGPQYMPGVRVAAGDVNGNGFPDILVASGAGTSPQYRIFEGANGALLRAGTAFTPDYMGGISIAAGDVNGDGFADIILGGGSGTISHVQIFSGTTGQQLASFMVNESFSSDAFASIPYETGVSVAAKDLDGDGIAEILTTKGSGTNAILRSFKLAGKIGLVTVPTGLISLTSRNVFEGFYGGITVGA